jgi:hypothetical protein
MHVRTFVFVGPVNRLWVCHRLFPGLGLSVGYRDVACIRPETEINPATGRMSVVNLEYHLQYNVRGGKNINDGGIRT